MSLSVRAERWRNASPREIAAAQPYVNHLCEVPGVERLRSGEALTEKDRRIHEVAACGVLRDLHDEQRYYDRGPHTYFG